MTTRFIYAKRIQAFSLVEVVIAIAVMSFSCLTLLGLLGVALNSVKQSIGATVQSNIMQNVINSAEIHSYTNDYGIYTNSTGISPAVFYYDDEGTQLPNGSANWVYTATVTSTPLSFPGAAGASASVAQFQSTSGTTTEPGVAANLKVVITAKNNPLAPAINTFIWPNIGI